MSTIPSAPTDEIFPVWVDLTNNWRAVDAGWIRDRLVHVFDDATERDGVITSSRQGMMGYLKNGETVTPPTTGCGLVFRTATGWETVRYPNLRVDSDATTVTLKRFAAGTGLVLKTDGSTEVAKLFAGAGGVGSTLDNTGISLKVGAKTAKLTTDATQLVVGAGADVTPLKVFGDIESTTTLKAPSGTFTGNVTAAGLTASGTVAAVTANVSGTVNAGLLNVATNAEVAIDTALAVFRHKASAANRLSFSSTGAAILTGSTVVVNGATTLSGAVTTSSTLALVGQATMAPAGKTPAPVAAVVAMNRVPTGADNYPNNTIWVQT